ncbi:MAG TPA: hypothetical protein DIT01_15675 [Lentisphaeria bacterium]|nr:hypothetical protein [Lentisphaeria bacterium]
MSGREEKPQAVILPDGAAVFVYRLDSGDIQFLTTDSDIGCFHVPTDSKIGLLTAPFGRTEETKTGHLRQDGPGAISELTVDGDAGRQLICGTNVGFVRVDA